MGAQWLGFLKKKGVSPTELDEFGLGNYLTGYQNAKVKKADFDNNGKIVDSCIAFANDILSPEIKVDENQYTLDLNSAN